MGDMENAGELVADAMQGARERAQEPRVSPPGPREESEEQERYRMRQMASLAGMNARELDASWELVPESIKVAIAGNTRAWESRKAIVSGTPVSHGFGLAGSAGIGKSMALACMFREGGQAVIRSREKRGLAAAQLYRPWYQWVRWPETVNRLRVMSTQDGGLARAEGFMRGCSTVPCLVLDDLGGERLKDYQEDWATTLLDLLLDHRHGAYLPTWYTTNLSKRQLGERYGARMFSRLCGENPVLELSERTDMRLMGRR